MLLSRNPGASTSEIALRAGVGRATLHRYFPSRADLLRALAAEAMAEIDAAIDSAQQPGLNARESLESYLETIVPIGDRSRFLWSLPEVMNDSEIRAGYVRQLEQARWLVERLKREGSIAADVPTDWVVGALDALTYAGWRSVEEGRIARNGAASLVLRTLLDGLSPPSRAPGGAP